METQEKIRDIMIAGGWGEYANNHWVAPGSLEEANAKLLFNLVRRDARERTLKRVGRVR